MKRIPYSSNYLNEEVGMDIKGYDKWALAYFYLYNKTWFYNIK